MSFLKERHREPELMDQPGLAEADHRAALAGLRRVNRISGGTDSLWKALRRLASANPGGSPLRVLDVACGGGDVAVDLAGRAKRANVPLILHGCDLSPTALKIAAEASHRADLSEMEFFRLNALNDPFPPGYDVIMCSLFLHHLSNAEAETLVRKMAESARRALLIDDLLRTRLGFALCWVGCRLLTRSHVVHTDGPLSVRAAFTEDEVRSLVECCGLKGARIDRHWPQRFLLSWERP